MDPNACLRRIISAIDANDTEEFQEAMADLYSWLRAGGFPPDTSDLGMHRVAVGFPGMRRNDPPMYKDEPRKIIVCRTGYNSALHLHNKGFAAFIGGRQVFSREW
jgi:hypothetical protein